MTPLHLIMNSIAAIGWLSLLLAPLRHRFCWVSARTCAMLLAFGWLAQILLGQGQPWQPQLFITSWPSIQTGGGAPVDLSLLQIQAFNLFVGSWQVEDSSRHNIAHPWLVPGLALTAVAGPLGLIVHMVIRDVHKWKMRKAEPGAK